MPTVKVFTTEVIESAEVFSVLFAHSVAKDFGCRLPRYGCAAIHFNSVSPTALRDSAETLSGVSCVVCQ